MQWPVVNSECERSTEKKGGEFRANQNEKTWKIDNVERETSRINIRTLDPFFDPAGHGLAIFSITDQRDASGSCTNFS